VERLPKIVEASGRRAEATPSPRKRKNLSGRLNRQQKLSEVNRKDVGSVGGGGSYELQVQAKERHQ
jgi:hypothetical protein